MAKETETTVPQSQTAMRPCPQDCRLCPMAQQIFCTTKMIFDLSRSQQALRDQMTELGKTVGVLRDQMQPKDAGEQLSIPFTEQKDAQEEDGAENRSSHK